MVMTHSEPVSSTSDVETLNFEGGEMFLIDKPVAWTSFDVVHRVRDLFHVKKVGHAGTLDPRASGLLIICTGKKTKIIDEFGGQEKEYEGVMQLGSTTASFDAETPEQDHKEFLAVTEDDVSKVFHGFLGTQMQIPPMYSAVKVHGKPLYKYARKGHLIERAAKEIMVSQFELTSMDLPLVSFRIVCSKGTYIRSIVHECGEKLKCGAFLKELRRTRIGEFLVSDAMDLEALHLLSQRLIPMKAL